MSNVMLIDVETVKKTSYVHKNVLPHTVEVTIQRVQKNMLRRVMGKEKYAELIKKVSDSLPPSSPIIPLDESTKELIEEYIHPYLVACVDYRIILPQTLRIRSKSVGKGTDENHTPADMTELIRLKDQMMKDVKACEEDLLEALNASSECTENVKPKNPWNNIKF